MPPGTRKLGLTELGTREPCCDSVVLGRDRLVSSTLHRARSQPLLPIGRIARSATRLMGLVTEFGGPHAPIVCQRPAPGAAARDQRSRHLAKDLAEFLRAERGERLGADVAHRADGQIERGRGGGVGRFERHDQVIVPSVQ